MCSWPSGDSLASSSGRTEWPSARMLVEGRLHIDGVPQHNHVDDDAECVELVFLAFTVTLSQLSRCAGLRKLTGIAASRRGGVA